MISRVAFILIVSVIGWPIRAHAETPCKNPTKPSVVVRNGEALCFQVSRGFWTVLELPPGSVARISDSDATEFSTLNEKDHHRLHVTPKSKAVAGTRIRHKLLADDFVADLVFEVVHTPLEMTNFRLEYVDSELAKLRRQQGRDAKRHAAQLAKKDRQLAEKDRQLAEKDQQLVAVQERSQADLERQRKRHDEERKKSAAERDRRRLDKESRAVVGPGETHRTLIYKPQYDRSALPREGDSKLDLKYGAWDSTGEHFFVRFDAVNNERPFCIAKAVTKTRSGQVLDTQIFVEGERTIAPGGRVMGRLAIRVEQVASFERQPQRIELKDCTGTRSLVRSILKWQGRAMQLALLTETPADAWARRARESTQLMLWPQIQRGYFWISNGRTGDGRELDAASFTGFGLRFTKGISHLVAFEASIVGGATGDAKFDMEAAQMTRSGKFGRIQGGFLGRFGEKWIPTARVGLGLQGTSYDSTVTGGMEPDDGVELSGLLVNIGGGLDYRLNEHFIIGIAATAVLPVGGEPASFGRTIAAGAHIGYGWTPDYEGD